MQLNEAQREAVQHVNGPMMVIAGPGSGKTAVLTRRIQSMIETAGILPERILVITFTRAAAEEMKQRFLKLMNWSDSEVTFGTFHSVFYSILRSKNQTAMRLVESAEAEQWLTEYMIETVKCDRQEARWRAFFVLSEYSRLLNTGTYAKQRMDESMGEGVFEDAVYYYREKKRLLHCIDFDDMLIQLRELLQKDRALLWNCREQFQYILVDEFQDINSVQFEILVQLASPKNNLFVVGDDDQAIYGFRGSQPEYLLRFPERYPEAKRVDLTMNYRCRKEIVESAVRLIDHNQVRYHKQCRSAVRGKGYVKILSTHTDENEAARVCDRIAMYAKEMPLEEIAVLYRTHAQNQKIIEKLMVWGIPYQCKDHTMDPMQSEMAEMFRAFIRYSVNRNVEDLREIWKVMAEQMPEYLIQDNLNMTDPRIQGMQMVILEEMDYHFRRMKKRSLSSAMLYVWKQMGYCHYMKHQCELQGVPWRVIEEHFEWLLAMAKKMRNKEEWLRYQTKSDGMGVQLMTMHGAKGLEFQSVIIIDANDGICPYEYALTENAMEEERRIFYVAMTRAKKYLDIFYTIRGKRRYKKSGFLQEVKY